jgi:hypothetical protein
VIVLDENIPFEERALLRQWRIRFRFVGEEIGYFGVKDPNIITILHQLKRPTFFTRDEDFFSNTLCHASYCLVWLNVPREETARFIRMFLRHPNFRTTADRMGLVVRVSHGGINCWRKPNRRIERVAWVLRP